MDGSDLSNGIKQVIDTLFRHKGKLLLYNMFVLLAVLAVVFFWPRKYGSEAKIWLKLGRESSKLDPTATTGETISIQENDREDDIKSIIDVISGRGVIASVVDKMSPEVVLGQAPLPGGKPGRPSSAVTQALKGAIGSVFKLVKMIDPVSVREDAIREIEEAIKVDAERKSNVVTIGYNTDSPDLAQAVVQAVLDDYKTKHISIHQTSGSRDFFEAQSKLLKDRVEEISQSIRATKDEMKITSIDGEKQILESELLHVQTAIMDTTSQAAEASAKVAELTRLLASQPPRIKSEERRVPNTGRDSLKTQLYALQMRRMELEAQLNAEHPLVQAARAQEAEASKTVADETTAERSEITETLNTIHQGLAISLSDAQAIQAGLSAMLDTLKSHEQELNQRMFELNANDVKIRQLERELQLSEANYMTYAANYEDARVDDELNLTAISSIGVAEEPTYQERPVSPSKAIVGALGGAAMMFGTVFLLAMLRVFDNSRLQDGVALQKSMGVPVMVSIPSRKLYNQVLR